MIIDEGEGELKKVWSKATVVFWTRRYQVESSRCPLILRSTSVMTKNACSNEIVTTQIKYLSYINKNKYVILYICIL